MMITGQNTQIFAISSILKQWEVKLTKKMQMGSIKTHKEFKRVLLGHMKALFQVDDSFDKLNGRECYNSIVGALTGAGVVSTNLVKEVYTEKEAKFLASRGQRIDDIHILA
jgi:hypothetical protein